MARPRATPARRRALHRREPAGRKQQDRRERRQNLQAAARAHRTGSARPSAAPGGLYAPLRGHPVRRTPRGVSRQVGSTAGRPLPHQAEPVTCRNHAVPDRSASLRIAAEARRKESARPSAAEAGGYAAVQQRVATSASVAAVSMSDAAVAVQHDAHDRRLGPPAGWRVRSHRTPDSAPVGQRPTDRPRSTAHRTDMLLSYRGLSPFAPLLPASAPRPPGSPQLASLHSHPTEPRHKRKATVHTPAPWLTHPLAAASVPGPGPTPATTARSTGTPTPRHDAA